MVISFKRTFSQMNWRSNSVCFDLGIEYRVGNQCVVFLLSHQTKGGVAGEMHNSLRTS